ncbi:MAG: hypothetical protein ABW184_07130 [Sphingobium sp.]
MMADNPSVGMVKRRQDVRRQIGIPWRFIFTIMAAVPLHYFIAWATDGVPNYALGKKGKYVVYIPYLIGAYGLLRLIIWPFERPRLKRELAELENFDRVEEYEKHIAGREQKLSG